MRSDVIRSVMRSDIRSAASGGSGACALCLDLGADG